MPGTYRVSVWVRDRDSGGAAGNNGGRWDTYATTAFTLTTCASVSGASTRRGATINVTATASGCPDASPLYQFAVLRPGTSAYQVVQAYSSNPTFTWDTTGAAPGSYRISIWVRDAASGGASGNSVGRWDAYDNGTVISLG